MACHGSRLKKLTIIFQQSHDFPTDVGNGFAHKFLHSTVIISLWFVCWTEVTLLGGVSATEGIELDIDEAQ
eukprot:3330614-Amphidinium_carterae.1